jgi:glycosyltransferase involved in cell wall biosynthesis
MNILELCLSAGLGGLELYVFRCSEALSNSATGNNSVIPVLRQHSKLDNYYRQHAAFDIRYIKPYFRQLPVMNAFRLAGIIDRNNIDIIHMHWGKDLPLAALARLFSRRKPALVYTRQMMITRPKTDFYHNFLYGQMALLLTITRELEGLCKKYIPVMADRITTLYYGVNEPQSFLDTTQIRQQRAALGFTSDDFIAGLIGRLEQSKGQHLLIAAIHQAKQQGQNIKALIVGHEMNPGYRDTLKQQASDLGVLDNIVFQDFTSQPQQLMQLCDCVILASGQETFGLVLAEAMRAGVAVIGSNSGGVPEIIDHENTGLLFDTGDANSLYRQIVRLYGDADFRRELAQQGKAKADRQFDTRSHFETLQKTFTTLVGP